MTGSGFESGESVVVTIGASDVIGTVTASSLGTLDAQLGVPASLPPQTTSLNFDGSMTGVSTEAVDLVIANVHFDAAGGQPEPDATLVAPGATVPAPSETPIRALSKFTGWVDDSGAPWNFATDTVPVGATDLIATYEARDTSVPPTVKVGEQMTIAGTGFEPGESVVITMLSDPVVLGTVVADTNGRIALTVAVPQGKIAGAHEIRFDGSLTGTNYERLVVTGPSDASLAQTGAYIALEVAVAAALVALGMLALHRRRMRTTPA